MLGCKSAEKGWQVSREGEGAWAQEDDNHQKRKEKITGTWVQGRQSLEEDGEDNGHLGA